MEFKEWLGDNELSYTIWNNKYRVNDESLDEWFDRVSNGNPRIKKLIQERKFLFAGRTLSNRGTNRGSYSNCYSSGFVHDSLQDILRVNNNIALTYKAQGGQGLSLSLLRPKGTPIGDYYESDGIIPFMELYNKTTETISQGGSRKGALLISLDVWHKEAPAFITIKSDLNKINKANLSVEIDDDFMKIIENYYSTGESPIIKVEREYSGHKIEYDVNPVELYKLICNQARTKSEPGLIFTNRFRNYNLMEFCDDYQIETCNPCGEQPLARNSACNLSSVNLSEYVSNPFTSEARIEWDELANDLKYIVQAMDDIIDENLNNHALPEQREMSYKYRNIGIGIMGLADLFIQLGIKYGSDESVELAHQIMNFMFKNCLKYSVELAKEKGSFPGYSSKVWDSNIIKNNLTEDEIEYYREQDCLRNCSLLSIAPTGSIGTMLNIGTGVEPLFQIKYVRRTESLNKEESYYDVYVKVAQDYQNITGNTELPDYFVTANDIDWHGRIKVQAALQDSCDTGISSTINLPEKTTTKEVEQIYLESWKNGLKGVTIYVAGSRNPILSTSKPTKIEQTGAPKRPKVLEADYYESKIKGEQFIVMVGLLEGKPYEIFTIRSFGNWNNGQHKGTITKVSKMHYRFDSDKVHIDDLKPETENIEETAATLYSSMLLRHGVDIEYIIKTAKKVNDNITSFSSAMCRVLAKYTKPRVTDEVCPECGAKLVMESSCKTCHQCGFSLCN